MKLRPSSFVTLPWRVARDLARPAAGAARKGFGMAGDVVDGLRAHAPGHLDEQGGEPVPPVRPEGQGAGSPRTSTAGTARSAPGPRSVPAPAPMPRSAPTPISPRPRARTSPPRAAPFPSEPAHTAAEIARETAEPAAPAHVSEEPVVVAEISDAGAEDGAGATLRVAEPWEGYGAMKGEQVIARIGSASREELAVIELYEATHRKRKTVIAAVERKLKADSGPAARKG